MLTVKYDLYERNDDGVVAAGSVDLSTETHSPAIVQAAVNDMIELNKNKKYHVAALNVETAAVLLKPKVGGRKVELEPDVVKFIHEKFVNDNVDLKVIPFKVHNKFEGLLVKDNIVKSVLAQERGTDVAGIDELREQAVKLLPAQSNNRRKYSDDDKAEWRRMHTEDGWSGFRIGKELGINSATINAHLKESGVQRNGRGRVKAVVTNA